MTERATSAQWFEPWRIDSPGGYQTLEASLHTIGRVVTVEVEPVAPDLTETPTTAPRAAHRVRVRVDKYRYHTPARQITTASGALAVYSRNVPTEEGTFPRGGSAESWDLIGRDPLLEERLLAELVKLAERLAVSD